MTQMLQIDRENPDSTVIQMAKDCLTRAGLVIVPTETVYGIACDPTVQGAMEKLVAAKGRDGKKPIARLAANGLQAKASAVNWNGGIEALAERYWPGPLTMVLETTDGWTGYRVPDHLVAIALAEACGHSLALTSANASGEPDTKTAQEAIASIAADLALDSGPSAEQAIPSTVVKVDGDHIECLREGKVPFPEIQAVFNQGMAQ